MHYASWRIANRAQHGWGRDLLSVGRSGTDYVPPRVGAAPFSGGRGALGYGPTSFLAGVFEMGWTYRAQVDAHYHYQTLHAGLALVLTVGKLMPRKSRALPCFREQSPRPRVHPMNSNLRTAVFGSRATGSLVRGLAQQRQAAEGGAR